MPTRKLLTNIHLALAAFFLPLMLLMPLSGGLYLLNFQGEQTKTEAFRIQAQVPSEQSQQSEFFKSIFADQGLDFNFEYIRSGGKDYVFRPSSRVHYVATQDGDDLIFSKLEPDLVKRLMEVHKGHGPRLLRILEIFFALALILTMISGLWLAWTVKPYRRTTLVSFTIGALLIALCLV